MLQRAMVTTPAYLLFFIIDVDLPTIACKKYGKNGFKLRESCDHK